MEHGTKSWENIQVMKDTICHGKMLLSQRIYTTLSTFQHYLNLNFVSLLHGTFQQLQVFGVASMKHVLAFQETLIIFETILQQN